MKHSDEPSIPFYRRRIAVIGAALLAMLAAAAGVWMIGASSLRMPDMPVRDVVFKGALTRVSPDELSRVARAIGQARVSMLSADLSEVKAVIKQVDWVREADIHRRFPSSLEVMLEEQQPVAKWRDIASDESGWVNTRGEVFRTRGTDESLAQLPKLAGPDGSSKEVLERFQSVTAMLKPVERAPRALTLTLRRAWQMELDNGSVLQVGRNDTDARLVRFVAAYPQVAALQADNARIDLRYQTGLAVKGVAATKSDSKKRS
jgi:cell division protein FtsQ